MSSFDEQIRRDARTAYAQQQKSQREAAIETANARGREAARLKALAENQEWKWFLETHLLPLLNAEHDAALDVSRSISDRNDSAQRHDAIKKAVGMLAEKAAEAAEAAQKAFAEIPQE